MGRAICPGLIDGGLNIIDTLETSGIRPVKPPKSSNLVVVNIDECSLHNYSMLLEEEKGDQTAATVMECHGAWGLNWCPVLSADYYTASTPQGMSINSVWIQK